MTKGHCYILASSVGIINILEIKTAVLQSKNKQGVKRVLPWFNMKLMHNMKVMRNIWNERSLTMFAHRPREEQKILQWFP